MKIHFDIDVIPISLSILFIIYLKTSENLSVCATFCFWLIKFLVLFHKIFIEFKTKSSRLRNFKTPNNIRPIKNYYFFCSFRFFSLQSALFLQKWIQEKSQVDRLIILNTRPDDQFIFARLFPNLNHFKRICNSIFEFADNL